jgi:conjugative transposon TraM protein
MQQQDDKRKKKQKLLIALPLFLILVAGLFFGGVSILKRKAPEAEPKMATKSAFNTKLPAPDLPAKEKNKFEIYMEAAKDSAKRKEEWEKDPNSKRFYDPGPTSQVKQPGKFRVTPSPKSRITPSTTEMIDPNEKKVNDRLQKLYAALNQSATGEKQGKQPMMNGAPGQGPFDQPNPQTAQLENLLQNARSSDTAVDPNLVRAEKVLDKVLDIQHPERVKERLQTGSVTTKPTEYTVTTSQPDTAQTEPVEQDIAAPGLNAFYGLEQEPDNDSTSNTTTIQAVVHETQTLQNGSTIKLRLLQDIFVGGHRIPANNFIYGQCSVNSERLNIQLTSAVCNDEIYPIALKVFDTDGLEGIYVPGAITRDVTKEGVSQGISGMGITSLDPSLGAQAASAGIETAKSLLSKKIKAVVVTVKAGHRVLLENPHSAH